MFRPAGFGVAKVAVPYDAHPVQLETLNMKLGRGVLEVVGGSYVLAFV
jgi:hypothetical protein